MKLNLISLILLLLFLLLVVYFYFEVVLEYKLCFRFKKTFSKVFNEFDLNRAIFLLDLKIEIEMNRLPPSPPPPPPPPPISLPPHISMMHERPTHASLRATYLNAFNQIFDNSINVNCICKTTTISTTNSKNSMKKLNMNVSSSPGYHQSNTHDDFMSSEDENGVSEDSIIQNLTNNLNNTNNSVTNFLDEVEKKLIELELLPLDDPTISKMQCDCSCFENLRCVYNVLKSCFRNSANNLNECIANFEKKWSRY